MEVDVQELLETVPCRSPSCLDVAWKAGYCRRCVRAVILAERDRLAEVKVTVDEGRKARRFADVAAEALLEDERRQAEVAALDPTPPPASSPRDAVIAEIRRIAVRDGIVPTSGEQKALAGRAVRAGLSWADAVEAAGYDRPRRGGPRQTIAPAVTLPTGEASPQGPQRCDGGPGTAGEPSGAASSSPSASAALLELSRLAVDVAAALERLAEALAVADPPV